MKKLPYQPRRTGSPTRYRPPTNPPHQHVAPGRPRRPAEARGRTVQPRRPAGGSPRMSREAVMRVASDLSRRVRGTAPKYIGAHRWSNSNESATFATQSPEYQQPVVVLVSAFQDGTLALDFFSSEELSELNRYENIVHFMYRNADIGEMVADIKWVWETVDGYAASWQQDSNGDVEEPRRQRNAYRPPSAGRRTRRTR